MLSNSEKVIKCMLAILDGRSGKGYNNYVFLGSIYGVGDVYSDLSIVKRDRSLYDFKSELITKLMKYKLLGIDGVYLINDEIALNLNRYQGKNIPSGIDAVFFNNTKNTNSLKLHNKFICMKDCDNISIRTELGFYGSDCTGLSIKAYDNEFICLSRLYESRVKVSIKQSGRLYAYKCMNCDFKIEENNIGSIYLDQCSNCSISYNKGKKPVILRSCIDMKVQTNNVIKVRY